MAAESPLVQVFSHEHAPSLVQDGDIGSITEVLLVWDLQYGWNAVPEDIKCVPAPSLQCTG